MSRALDAWGAWPPPVAALVREGRIRKVEALEYARQAEDRIRALQGRGVVRDSSEVVAVLVAAGLIDGAE